MSHKLTFLSHYILKVRLGSVGLDLGLVIVFMSILDFVYCQNLFLLELIILLITNRRSMVCVCVQVNLFC